MAVSGYLARQAQHTQDTMLTVQAIIQQLCMDTAQITLYQDFGWDYDQISEFCQKWGETYDSAWPAFSRPQDKLSDERDKYRRDLDACLQEIVEGHSELIPFDKRYPDMLPVSYAGRKR